MTYWTSDDSNHWIGWPSPETTPQYMPSLEFVPFEVHPRQNGKNPVYIHCNHCPGNHNDNRPCIWKECSGCYAIEWYD